MDLVFFIYIVPAEDTMDWLSGSFGGPLRRALNTLYMAVWCIVKAAMLVSRNTKTKRNRANNRQVCGEIILPDGRVTMLSCRSLVLADEDAA
jgi:hypothetical protein